MIHQIKPIGMEEHSGSQQPKVCINLAKLANSTIRDEMRILLNGDLVACTVSLQCTHAHNVQFCLCPELDAPLPRQHCGPQRSAEKCARMCPETIGFLMKMVTGAYRMGWRLWRLWRLSLAPMAPMAPIRRLSGGRRLSGAYQPCRMVSLSV